MISKSFFPSFFFCLLFQLLCMTLADSDIFSSACLFLVSQLRAHAWMSMEASCKMSLFMMKAGWW